MTTIHTTHRLGVLAGYLHKIVWDRIARKDPGGFGDERIIQSMALPAPIASCEDLRASFKSQRRARPGRKSVYCFKQVVSRVGFDCVYDAACQALQSDYDLLVVTVGTLLIFTLPI